MGYRVSWVACKDWGLEDLVAVTGTTAGPKESLMNLGIYAATPVGWGVIIGDGSHYFGRITSDFAQDCSQETDTIFFYANDTVMMSVIMGFQDQELVWQVSSDCSYGDAPAIAEGAVPADLLPLIKAAGNEGYEVPAEIGRKLVGIMHGEEFPVVLLDRND